MRPNRLALCAIGALALAACGPQHALTPAQSLEQADTAASLAYAATATALNSYEALPTTTAAQKANAESIKTQAWAALQQERALYAAGQPITTVLGQLQSLEAQAKALH